MVRTVVPGMALSLLILTGCASNSHGDLVRPNGSVGDKTDNVTEGDDSSRLPEAADGTDIDACFDGRCEVEIAGSATIALDKKFGIDSLKVTVDSGVATAKITDTSGGKGTITLSGSGGVATSNNLTLVGVAVEGDTAILELTAV